MQIDTGARCNVISQSVLQKLKVKTALKKTQSKLRSYSGHSFGEIGSVKLPCKFRNDIFDIEFQVTEQKAPTILGSETSQQVGLIQRMFKLDNPVENIDNSDIQRDYSDVFKGKHKIHIDSSVTPVIHPPRRILVSMRDKVKNELSRMVKEGIKRVKSLQVGSTVWSL